MREHHLFCELERSTFQAEGAARSNREHEPEVDVQQVTLGRNEDVTVMAVLNLNRTEQNRTEQTRTEKHVTEQKRTEQISERRHK